MTQNTSPLRALLNVEASASVPKLSNAQMLDAPENSAIRDIWLLPPDNSKLHVGRKVAVVATDGVEEIELNTVLHYFRSRGAQVDLIAPKKPSYPYFLGLQIPAVRGLKADNFLTVVYQIDRHCRRLLWVGRRRSQATLRRGLKALGPEGGKGLRFVCSDIGMP